MNVVELRFYVSTLLMVDFAILLISGIALYLALSGPSVVFGVSKSCGRACTLLPALPWLLSWPCTSFLNWGMYRAEANLP